MRLAFFAIVLVGCSGGSFDVASTTTDAATADTIVTNDSETTDSSVDDGATTDTSVTPDAPPPADTGTTPDMGPTCPQPASTKVWDVTEFKDCGVIRTKYIDAVQASKPCTCDADCSQKIDPNLCGCATFVNPGHDESPLAVALAARYEKLMCVAACPATPCKPVTTAKCVATTGGPRCQDL